MPTKPCYCCGKPGYLTKVDSGAMHMDCYLEHHCGPDVPWPPTHTCVYENPFRRCGRYLFCNTCDYKSLDDGIGNAVMHAHLQTHKDTEKWQ